MKRIGYLLICLCFFLLVSGCSQTAKTKIPDIAAQETAQPLRVAAAADLTLAFQEIGKNYEKLNGTKLDFIFGSTGTLEQQIENGAPYDVFAAASTRYVDALKSKGLIIPGTQQLYARGSIGLATTTASSLQVKELKDLLKPEIKKIAIANPEHAPYGMAAKQALEKAGIWELVKGKLVYGKNIQDTLTLIKTGNAETGIIALSIAKKDEVYFSRIREDMYKPLNQSMAVTAGTKQAQRARQFIAYVNSPEGRKVMKKYGFNLPGEVLASNDRP